MCGKIFRYGTVIAMSVCCFTHCAGAVTECAHPRKICHQYINFLGIDKITGVGSDAEDDALSSDAAELCNELLRDALSVSDMLRGIDSRASAERAGSQLDIIFRRIDNNLKRLAELNVSDSSVSAIIKSEMVALTQIAQESLRLIQRLSEVGAYGSDKLTDVFAKYKLIQHAEPTIQTEDLPHERLLTNLADTVDDALYILRRVHDEASARDASNSIDSLLVQIEESRHTLTQLAPPRTEELREALRPTRERVHRLGDDVRLINDQLKSHNYFGSSRLGPIIERLISATVN